MAKEHKTYHRIEGTERRINKAYKIAMQTLTEGKAYKFPKSISFQCTKTEWNEICEKLNIVEWKPKFAIY